MEENKIEEIDLNTIHTSAEPAKKPIKVSNLDKKNKLIVVGAVLILLIFAVVLIVILTSGRSELTTNDTQEINSEEISENTIDSNTQTEEIIEDEEILTNSRKLYYEINNELIKYSIDDNTESTFYKSQTDLNQVVGISETSNGDIGFGACSLEGDNNICKIQYVESLSGKSTVLETFTKDQSLLAVDIIDTKNYSYLLRDSSTEFWTESLIEVLNGKKRELHKFTGEIAGSNGRGGFEGDDFKVEYSTDNSRISMISTGNIQNNMDFTIRIFENGSLTDTIEDATHPLWVADNLLAYRKFEQQDQTDYGIYLFNTENKTKSLVITDTKYDSYRTFSNYKKNYIFSNEELTIFNYDSVKTSEIYKEGINPIYLNENVIVFTPTEPCTENCFVDYTQLDPVIYDMVNKAFLKTLTGVNQYFVE